LLYKFQRRSQVDWEKVPFVPRPSLVADPITAYGRREKVVPKPLSVLSPEFRASIKPSLVVLNSPIKPYVSARDQTREKIKLAVQRHDLIYEQGVQVAGLTEKDHMDKVLPKVHRTSASWTPKTRVFYSNYASY
jgi:hypothetical protein